MPVNKTLVISRPDRLGDLICALPAVAWAKASGQRSFLHLSAGLERIGEWAVANGVCDGFGTQAQDFRSESLRGVVALVHNPHSRDFVRRARVPSVGPQTRLSAFWSYGWTLRQKRSLCEKSETQYNLDLIQFYFTKCGLDLVPWKGLGPLRVPDSWAAPALRGDCVLNVSNRSSAPNASIETYLDWGDRAEKDGQSVVVLAVGDDASERAARFKQLRPHWPVLGAFDDLSQLVGLLSRAHCVVTSSTGALHVATALGVPRIHAFFPRSGTGQWKRWKPDGYWTSSVLTHSILN
jgi:ADP-heptose:LPS heptosyltransferase